MPTEAIVDPEKVVYLDLEKNLYVLIWHFRQCKGCEDSEVLDWAKFFVNWAKSASAHCGPWSRRILEQAQNTVKDLERSHKGKSGYLSLGRAMNGAYNSLNFEIWKNLSLKSENRIFEEGEKAWG